MKGIGLILTFCLGIAGCAVDPPVTDQLTGTWNINGFQCSGSTDSTLTPLITAGTYRFKAVFTGESATLTETTSGCAITRTVTVAPQSQSLIKFTGSGTLTCSPANCSSSCGSAATDAQRYTVTLQTQRDATLTQIETTDAFSAKCAGDDTPPATVILLKE